MGNDKKSNWIVVVTLVFMFMYFWYKLLEAPFALVDGETKAGIALILAGISYFVLNKFILKHFDL